VQVRIAAKQARHQQLRPGTGSQLSLEHGPMASATLTATARQMPAMQQYTTLQKNTVS
jgi:hypothetical protein